MRAGLLGAALVLLVGCGGGRAAPKQAPEASALSARVTGPEGRDLVSACTPTGPELCFNAIDDNCNGVIDEGCGVGTGVLQFIVAWGDGAADIDLAVVGPAGERVQQDGAHGTPAGLRLGADCRGGESCHGQNFEQAVFEGADPPKGRYTVEIKLSVVGNAPLPVRARFGARVGARSYGADVVLGRADEKVAFAFDL